MSRLLRFHGRSPLAMQLRRQAGELRRLIAQAGGSHVRVFGSVATGAEHEGSDIDLLFAMGTPMGALRPDLRDRVLAQAVPL